MRAKTGNPSGDTGAVPGYGPDTDQLGLAFPPPAAVGAPDLAQRPPPGRRRLWRAITGGTAAIVLAGAVLAGAAFMGHRLPLHHPAVTPSASRPPAPPPAGTGGDGDGMVMTAPGVRGNPGTPAVLAFLNSYFAAINNHDYQQYLSLLDQQMQSGASPGSFSAGYSSTTDSAATLTQVSPVAGADVAATVAFTSHQQPSQGRDHTACTTWTITVYLEPHGARYVRMHPPPGYKAPDQYQPCQ